MVCSVSFSSYSIWHAGEAVLFCFVQHFCYILLYIACGKLQTGRLSSCQPFKKGRFCAQQRVLSSHLNYGSPESLLPFNSLSFGRHQCLARFCTMLSEIIKAVAIFFLTQTCNKAIHNLLSWPVCRVPWGSWWPMSLVEELDSYIRQNYTSMDGVHEFVDFWSHFLSFFGSLG